VDYRKRRISNESMNFLTFMRQLAAGKFLVPTFQRLFVWNPEDICGLWDSLFHHYPIGSILCWNTAIRLHVHRKIGGFLIPENDCPGNDNDEKGKRLYILDGQQRATALLASFHGGSGRIREHFSFDYTMYFDLTTARFFFEKDYYRYRRDADAAFLLRLGETPDLPDDYCRTLTGLQRYSPRVEHNLEQLRYLFSDYRISLINLEGFSIEGVCAIYERINQTGRRLENLDILIARGFRNYSTVIDEDFPVT
jgi:hypothetical protein